MGIATARTPRGLPTFSNSAPHADQKHSTAQTVEDENRELHGKIRALNSENNMLKYRNEVLMQMVRRPSSAEPPQPYSFWPADAAAYPLAFLAADGSQAGLGKVQCDEGGRGV